jgi:hypothetical protein
MMNNIKKKIVMTSFLLVFMSGSVFCAQVTIDDRWFSKKGREDIGNNFATIGRWFKNNHTFYFVEILKQDNNPCPKLTDIAFFEPAVKFWGKAVLNDKTAELTCECVAENCCDVLNEKLGNLRSDLAAGKGLWGEDIFQSAKSALQTGKGNQHFRIIKGGLGKKYLKNKWSGEQKEHELIKAIKTLEGDNFVFLNKKGKCKSIKKY